MYARTCSRFAVAAALLAQTVGAAAQSPTGPPADSYQRAAAVMRDAVRAHGGLVAIRGLTGIDYTWTGVTFERYGGRDPATADDPLPPTQPVRTRTAIDFRAPRWLNEIDLSSPGGIRSVMRSALNGRATLGYDALGYAGGATFTRDTLAAGAAAPSPFTVNLMPPVLLRQAVTREHTLRHLGETRESGRREHVVMWVNADGSLATVRVDDETKRLVGVASVTRAPLFGDILPTWRFSDYRVVDGLLVPHAFEHHTNGELQLRSRLTTVVVNPVLADSLFEPPAGYVPRAPGGPPQLVDAGGGVFFVDRLGGDARSMFVDTEDGVVAFEAPGNPAVAERAIALVERALPGRPIRYVVLTHHHTENFGGLEAYVARGATILVPAGAGEYVRRLLARPRAFGDWTRPADGAAPAPVVEEVRGRRLIGSRDRGVEVLDVGSTSHASRMLLGYAPARRLLFQADLLRVNEEAGPVIPTQAAADLASIVDRMVPEVERIAGVRGKVATRDDLRAAASGAQRGAKP